MSADRPKIAAALAARLVAQIPSRLIKKLDADPTLASRWTWQRAAGTWTVKTDKDDTVRLRGGEVIDDVACSCLLSPKCLHVGAVVSAMEPADASECDSDRNSDNGSVRPAAIDTEIGTAAGAGTGTKTGTETGSGATATVTATSADPAAAVRSFRALADILAAGAAASGAFAQAELLRAIHACRGAGLHRLATAQTRVLRSLRDLRGDRPEFALAVLAADLREAFAVAHALARGESSAALVGAARRDYETIGNLHLRGVFTEAIVARSGHAGAVTYLVDDKGTIYTRADVAPGDAGRAAGAYDAPAAIGDAVLPHRELCRSGLFVSEATASYTRRLGAGQKVRAVRAREPSRWDAAPLAVRWDAPLAAQLAAIAAHDASPDEQRPAGWDLVFVEGVLATQPDGLAFACGDVALDVTTSLDHRALVARDNLAILARAPGLHVRAIGRVRLAAPRRIDLLAVAPAVGETRLALPDTWHGRANLHYDKLAIPAPKIGAIAIAVAPSRGLDDLLAPLRRRVERVVEGGLATLPTHALPDVEREAARLGAHALRGGADALRELAAVAHDADRAMTGARRAIDRPSFARAWLRAAIYDDAARRRLALASW
jgi:hypothetical protein